MIVIAIRILMGALLLLAAACDIRSLRIPNLIPLSLIVLFVASEMVGTQSGLEPHLISFFIASVLGLALFASNIWGGGDAKLIAAVALFLTPPEFGRFLLITGLAGGVVAGTILIGRRLATHPWLTRAGIPYGVALAAGGLDFCLLR